MLNSLKKIIVGAIKQLAKSNFRYNEYVYILMLFYMESNFISAVMGVMTPKEVYVLKDKLRVDSLNWKKKEIGGITVKINPDGDITEFLDGPEAGEQLFTWEAAMRETQKQGLRLPTHNEIESIINIIGIDELRRILAGHRLSDCSDFYDRGNNTHLWTSSEDKGCVYSRILNFEHNCPIVWLGSKSAGFSVICLKD